jgi:hypothetical protein
MIDILYIDICYMDFIFLHRLLEPFMRSCLSICVFHLTSQMKAFTHRWHSHIHWLLWLFCHKPNYVFNISVTGTWFMGSMLISYCNLIIYFQACICIFCSYPGTLFTSHSYILHSLYLPSSDVLGIYFTYMFFFQACICISCPCHR